MFTITFINDDLLKIIDFKCSAFNNKNGMYIDEIEFAVYFSYYNNFTIHQNNVLIKTQKNRYFYWFKMMRWKYLFYSTLMKNQCFLFAEQKIVLVPIIND